MNYSTSVADRPSATRSLHVARPPLRRSKRRHRRRSRSAAAAAAAAEWPDIAGYRLVEQLDTASGTPRYLASPNDSPNPAADRVVVAVHSAESTELARENARLWQRLDSAHCPQFLDEVELASGVTIVTPWLRCGSLRALLERRRLRVGEAVTILVPIAQVLARVHALGGVHGDVCAPNIHFDERGTPVLLGWGKAVHRRAGATDLSFESDARQFVDLSLEVLSRCLVDGAEMPSLVADFLATTPPLATQGDSAVFFETAEKHLFELSDPRAIDPLVPYDWGAESAAALARVEAAVNGAVELRALSQRPAARLHRTRSELTRTVQDLPRVVVAASARIRSAGGLPIWPGSQSKLRVKTLIVAAVVCAVAVTGALVATPRHPDSAQQSAAVVPRAPAAPEAVSEAPAASSASVTSTASPTVSPATAPSPGAADEERTEPPTQSAPNSSAASSSSDSSPTSADARGTAAEVATSPAANSLTPPDTGAAATATRTPANTAAAPRTLADIAAAPPTSADIAAAPPTSADTAAAPPTSADTATAPPEPADTATAPQEPAAQASTTDAPPAPAVPTDSELAAAIAGDDPAAAMAALLTRRARCFDQQQAACFDGVDQQQSPALADDEDAFGNLLRSGARPTKIVFAADATTSDAGSPGAGIERIGDAALIMVQLTDAAAVVTDVESSAAAHPAPTDVSAQPSPWEVWPRPPLAAAAQTPVSVQATTPVPNAAGPTAAAATATAATAAAAANAKQPASALLVKGETGWRIRSVFVSTG